LAFFAIKLILGIFAAKKAKILHPKIVPFVPTKKPRALSSSHCNIGKL
jgi:hypothetical protein